MQNRFPFRVTYFLMMISLEMEQQSDITTRPASVVNILDTIYHEIVDYARINCSLTTCWQKNVLFWERNLVPAARNEAFVKVKLQALLAGVIGQSEPAGPALASQDH